ncbi:MAG: metal ABC transporter substrate-binding protein [Desulfobulbaceae bacterium]|nr:metal ABC transporter substrate-binding protein [Desulfobulbaceae bacterium]
MKSPRLLPLLLFFVVFILTVPVASAGDTPRRYVASIHPLAAILREITLGRAEVSRLLPPGGSPHTFEPKPSDLKGIASAQAFFYGGPGLDGEWVQKLPIVLKVSMLKLVPEAERLMMTDGHEHPPVAGDADENEQHQAGFVDPHFWTDPLTVKAMVPQLVAELCNIDPAGKPIYVANGERFKQRLDQLDRELRVILKPLAGEPLLLFHPSFNYLIHRYNLQSAGVVVEAPGREPSPKFLMELVKRIKEEKIKALFTEPQLAKRPAQVLAEAAGIPVYELDPIGGVPGRESYPGLLLHIGVTLTKAIISAPEQGKR